MDLELGQSLETDIWCHNARWMKYACQFSWAISTFSKCILKPGLFLTSKTFKTSCPGSCTWYLKLYPNGLKDEDSDYIHVALCVNSEYDSVANYFVCIRSQEEKLEHVFASTMELVASTNEVKISSLIERKLLQQNESLLPNDTLTIHCVIAEKTAVGDKRTVLWERNYFKEKAYYESTTRVILSEDMYTLLESGAFYDVALNAQGTDCLAHRSILATRSAVFGEMFTHQPKQFRFYINNLDSWTLGAMLRYIYSKEHGYLTEENACRLLGAAKMYRLRHLEKTCFTFLTSVINKGNSLKLLRLGHLLKDKELMRASMRFIHSFQKAAIGNDTWNIMLECDSDLQSDVSNCLIEIEAAQSKEKKQKRGKKKTDLNDAADASSFPHYTRRLTWTIEQFKQHCCFTHSPTFNSPDFQLSDRSDFRWRIELMISPKTKKKDCRLSILMLRITTKEVSGKVNYECFIVDKDKKLRELTKGGADNTTTVPFDVTDEELVPKNSLTLHFVIKFHHHRDNQSSNPVSSSWCVLQNSLIEDLRKLFVHGMSFSDVTVSCDGFETGAHKCVLAARSRTWCTMFRNNKSLNTVDIQGADADLLMDMLNYVYTGELNNLTEFTACKLFVIAKSYEIQGLRELCSEFLSSRVSASNALDYLLMAKENGDGRLSMYTSSFVRFHADVMIPQRKWEEFLRKYGLLALEILIGPFH